MSDTVSETPKQNQAFLAYTQLPVQSSKRLWEAWRKIRGLSEYQRPSARTLERWCTKYEWVERAKQIHNKAKDVAIKKTIEELVLSKEEILSGTRAIMIRFLKQLQDNAQGKLTVVDFKEAWKIQRIELGLPIEIGKQEVAVDLYEGVSDDQLVEMLESLTKRYKERIKDEGSNS